MRDLRPDFGFLQPGDILTIGLQEASGEAENLTETLHEQDVNPLDLCSVQLEEDTDSFPSSVDLDDPPPSAEDILGLQSIFDEKLPEDVSDLLMQGDLFKTISQLVKEEEERCVSPEEVNVYANATPLRLILPDISGEDQPVQEQEPILPRGGTEDRESPKDQPLQRVERGHPRDEALLLRAERAPWPRSAPS